MKEVKNTDGKFAIHEDGVLYKLYKNGNEPKIKIPLLTKEGYSYCRIAINGIQKMVFIHRLVAETFIPNPENKRCVDHIDEDKLNNSVKNLRWCTHHENMTFYSNGGRSVNRIPHIKRLLQKAKNTRDEINEINIEIKENINELKRIEKQIIIDLLKNRKETISKRSYEKWKDTTGVKYNTVEEMVKNTGKFVYVNNNKFPSAGAAAKFIFAETGRSTIKDISRRIRKFLADPKKLKCNIYNNYSIT